MPTPPYPLHPEPMQKNWLEPHPRWKIPLGCLTLIFRIGVFVTVLLTIITTAFHSSDVYKHAMAKATRGSGGARAGRRAGPIGVDYFRTIAREREQRRRQSRNSHLRSQRERFDPRRRAQYGRRLAVQLPAGQHRGRARKHRSALGPAPARTRLLSRRERTVSECPGN